MDQYNRHFGLYLIQKSHPDKCVLKELLQFLKVQNPGKSVNFSYVEADSSLIPHLTLWENIHVAVGGAGWKDFRDGLSPEMKSLAALITCPDDLVSVASPWERLITGLLKGLVTGPHNLLVDMNEDLHSPLNLQIFKKILQNIGSGKQIYLASSNTSLWLDSCYGLVTRSGHEFKIELIGKENLKVRRSA